MNCNVRNSVVLSIATVFLAGCGGGKVVVLPSTPAPSSLVATAPSAPAVVATIPATPALPAETVAGVSPGADYVWVAGYYNWQVDHYTWVPGQWVQAPHSGVVWVPARWQPTANGYTWVPGHWQ